MRRIIVLTGLRMQSFDSQGFATKPTLAEAEYVAWTQWELTFSVLATIFPSTRKSFLNLVTYYNSGHYAQKTASTMPYGPADESIPMKTFTDRGASSGSILQQIGEDEEDDHGSETLIIQRRRSFAVTIDDPGESDLAVLGPRVDP